MSVDPEIIPGLLILAAELLALAAVGFVVARVALRQTDDGLALAQGLIVGPALWGLTVNLLLYAIPGLAGVLTGWAAILLLGAGLAWRASHPLRPRLRTVAGFTVAALALFWVVLASRQLVGVPDAHLHLGLTASIQAGGHPPTFPWNPGLPTAYHYGANLLTGLLAPPIGPDTGFTIEIIDAYIWTSFALVVGTLVRQRGSWIAVLAFVPLLLTAGAWTQVHYARPYGILQFPAPSDFPTPAASIPAWLAGGYWPSPKFPASHALEFDASPPNIWKPFFVLAYALAVIVLERAAAGGRRSWTRVLVLAALLGFLGLADETVALAVLGLWVILEAAWFRTHRQTVTARWRRAALASAGPLAAALLLAVGGGAITGFLATSATTGLSLEWIDDPGGRRPLGAFIPLEGGFGLLSLGVVPVAAGAVLLAWRDRLVLALVAAGGGFLFLALTLHYDFSPDVVRLDGHARNFTLLALLVGLGSALHALRPRWRYAVAALAVALIVWPTVVVPVRNLGFALDQGVLLANGQPGQRDFAHSYARRHAAGQHIAERVVVYIRDHVAADARILSPHPTHLSIATGRPDASGFAQFIHYSVANGPDYLDAINNLEASVIRRRGWTYLHATDAWLDGLPPRSRRWIEDPALFEPLVRDGAQTLYRIQPAFLQLDVAPAPESFEALRRAVPASATVYLSPTIDGMGSVRAASVLSHARLLGFVRIIDAHLRPNFPTEALGDRTPDLVVASPRLAPSAFAPGSRTPIWWNDEFAVYAPQGAVEPIMPPRTPLLSVRLSSVRVDDGRLAFTVTLSDRAADRWTGHGWLVVPTDASPWHFPRDLERDGRVRAAAVWFGGQFAPGRGITSRAYEFDAHAASLAVQGDDDRFVPAPSSASSLGPGSWILAFRLLHGWWESAFVPVAHVRIAPTGEISFQVYEGALSVVPVPVE